MSYGGDEWLAGERENSEEQRIDRSDEWMQEEQEEEEEEEEEESWARRDMHVCGAVGQRRRKESNTWGSYCYFHLSKVTSYARRRRRRYCHHHHYDYQGEGTGNETLQMNDGKYGKKLIN